MGTSASNSGPKGSPPLLPDWYDDDSSQPPQSDPPADENQQPEIITPPNPQPDHQPIIQPIILQPLPPSRDWGKSKGALTRVSNNTSGSSSRKAGRSYVRSLGGSRSAVRAAQQGIKTGNKYARFLGSLSSNGLNNTLSTLGLDFYIGKSSDEVCAAIANALCPIGATNDEAIARDALISTLDSLYMKLDADGNLDSLNNLTPELIKETLIDYVSNFVFCKWMYELGSAIEKGDISEQQAINLEREVKDLIVTDTIERYRDTPISEFNLNDTNNVRLISEIFETAYSILEL